MNGVRETDLQSLHRSESQLATRAAALCEQLERCDEFDDEQLAEMHAILRAIAREAACDAETIAGILEVASN